MRYKELAKKLRRLGCELDRQSRGSHEIWRNRLKGTRATVPNSGSKDLPKGTLSAILRHLGIAKDEFDSA